MRVSSFSHKQLRLFKTFPFLVFIWLIFVSCPDILLLLSVRYLPYLPRDTHGPAVPWISRRVVGSPRVQCWGRRQCGVRSMFCYQSSFCFSPLLSPLATPFFQVWHPVIYKHIFRLVSVAGGLQGQIMPMTAGKPRCVCSKSPTGTLQILDDFYTRAGAPNISMRPSCE